jgi:hypothetical protein
MKKVLCLMAALTLALSTLGCKKIQARMEIKSANEAYQEDYAGAPVQTARLIDPSFPDLTGWSAIRDRALRLTTSRRRTKRTPCRHQELNVLKNGRKTASQATR